MVPLMRVSSSSSPLIASCKCLGVILFTFRSLLAFPANSRTSAVRYSRIDAKYTAAVAPTRPLACTLCFNCLWIRPTGNYSHTKKKIKTIQSMHQTVSRRPSSLSQIFDLILTVGILHQKIPTIHKHFNCSQKR